MQNMSTLKRYRDIDLNFMPNPSAFERISGKGYLTYTSGSPIVTGFDTEFTRYLSIDDNLYVSNSFVGKVKSIESDASLTLYNNALLSIMTDLYDETYLQLTYSTISQSTFKFKRNGLEYYLDISNLSNNQIESGVIRFDITTNFSDTENYPIKYKILGLDSYDVVGEYPRNSDLSFNISDYLSGTLTFDEKSQNVYNAYVQIKTVTDNVLENIEHVIFVIELEDSSNFITISDANFTFSHPGDITFKIDANAVKTSIEHLVRTINYERPFNSNLGSQITNLLFAGGSAAYAQIIKRTIKEVIFDYEPRATVTQVDVLVSPEDSTNSAKINIEFYIAESNLPYTLNLTLERTR
jgi:phage baseplate assembly protein W